MDKIIHTAARRAGVAIGALLLAACSAMPPGGFERLDADDDSVSVQYRFDPQQVDQAAMDKDALLYCQGKGYDRADKLPDTKGNSAKWVKRWYKCEWDAGRARN